jgi:uncharacterized protein YhjY with autotransporter beta-barrel domain
MGSIMLKRGTRASVTVSMLLAAPLLTHAAPPTVPGATPLQQSVFNGVFNMCTKDLDNVPLVGAQVNDLHDQCHAIAVSTLTNTGTQFNNALGALQQVSGNEISTQGSLATRVSAGQFGNITGRLNALRLGSGLGPIHGLTAFDGNPSDGSSVAVAGARSSFTGASYGDSGYNSGSGGYLPVSLQSQGGLITTAYSSDEPLHLAQNGNSSGSGGGFTPAAVQNPWGIFIDGSYNSGHHDQTSNEDPFHFHATSVTAGVDYNFGTAVLGVSVGHDDYDAGIQESGVNVSPGSARVHGTSGSVYGAWFGQNWLFNGIATYGRLSTDLSRSVKYNVSYNGITDPDQQATISDNCPAGNCSVGVDRTLIGSPSGRTTAVGLTAGYQVTYGLWNIVPSITANYRRATFDSFSETDPNDPNDGLGLTFNDQTVESMRSIAGLDLSRPISAPFGVVTPLLRVEWNHEFKTGGRSIIARYSFDPTANGVCDSCFALPTDSSASNYGVAGVGVSVTLPHRVQAYVYDEALFGFSDYHSNAITLGVRGQF